MSLRRECANAIRVLAMDAVQQANSGHPGMPMGMADIAEVLWRDFLIFNPKNPEWCNRDRFVLSNGHGVMLHYALLHLTGFDLSMEDLKQFRQWHSRTPGHPEFPITPGVETTTGPLGQGLAAAVGMVIAERALASTFNRDSFNIIDHHTYVFVGDGDLMEGISHEACSLAGTLGLGKLVVIYDDNGISIDGDVKNWFNEDVPKRFSAYGWHVIPDVGGHDAKSVHQAIAAAKQTLDRPSLICCKTVIGYGAPLLAGKALTHGAPLGEKEIDGARHILGWSYPPFKIPDAIYQAWDATAKGGALESEWQALFDRYQGAYPELALELLRRLKGELPKQWETLIPEWMNEVKANRDDKASRRSSLFCLEKIASVLPELMGGSADLSESNGVLWAGAKMFSVTHPDGNYIQYGVREFAMTAILNGIALHGGFIPYAGTFLTFSDYARNAIRLAAMMQIHAVFVYSHDSIGLGEDGPTHQPIEQLVSLRLIPGLRVWRPCDSLETAVAWQQVIEHHGPSCMVLTRQAVPQQDRTDQGCADIARGGYVLWEPQELVSVILIATGSEVDVAVKAAQRLATKHIFVRVVSMPCCELFKRQSQAYREAVLPNKIEKRVAVEAGSVDYWYQFVGLKGKVVGMHDFGASAPADRLFKEFGLTESHIMSVIEKI